MQVNKSIYPDFFEGDNITLSHAPATYPLDTPMDDSICFSMSTADFAPYNDIMYLYADANTQTYHSDRQPKTVQKIALLMPSSDIDVWTDEHQNPNAGAVDDPLLQMWTARGDKTVREAGVNNPYTFTDIYFCSAINLQNILGVIMVRMRDNRCISLAEYNRLYSGQQVNCVYMDIHTTNGIFRGNTKNGGFLVQDLEPHPMSYWWFDDNDNSFTQTVATYYPIGINAENYIESTGQARNVSARTCIVPLVGVVGNRSTANQVQGQYISRYVGAPVFGAKYSGVVMDSIRANVVVDTSILNTSTIYQIAATYGVPFTDNYISDYNDIYAGDKSTYIPIANSNGLYNGDYEVLTVDGALSPDITEENADLWNGGKNAPFDNRNPEPDAPETVDEIQLTQPALSAIDAFNRTYIINQNDVDDLGQQLYTADDSIIDRILAGLKMFGENPMNGIIDLRLYPFDVRARLGAADIESIHIGTYDTNIIAYRMPSSARAVIDLGSVDLYQYFKSFLDYEPYTECELYIPFIGVMPISTAHFSGKTINIKLVVDYLTGAATAIIYVVEGAKQHPVLYKHGVIGVSISLTGDNAAGEAQSILGKLIGGAESVVEGAATGNAAEFFQGGLQVFGAAAQPTMYQSAGASTPQTSLYTPDKPYLIIYTANTAIPDNYAHAVGYACEDTVKIGECVGYNVFANIDTSGIIATAEELAELKSLLESGVII